MARVPLVLNQVVETRSSLAHGHRADRLSNHCQGKASHTNKFPNVKRRPLCVWKKHIGDEAFERGKAVGDGVAGPVGREEKGRDLGCSGVVRGRGPEFEKVKGGEGSEKKGQAPERGGGEEEDVERARDANREGYSEAKGADGDPGEGLGLSRVVETVWVVVGQSAVIFRVSFGILLGGLGTFDRMDLSL